MIGWLAERTGLPVVVKGVLRGDDAKRCADAGAAGIIVSNHGGRQLDGSIPTARALPEVAEASPEATSRCTSTAASAAASMSWPRWPSAPARCSSAVPRCGP